MNRSWRFVVLIGAAVVALVVFAGLGAAQTPGDPTSTVVPPNCDPPRMCPVVVDTDQDGYSDYDENAYGSDPNDPKSTPESWAFGSCGDGVDNDLDGLTDSEDKGCSDPCSSLTPMPAQSPGQVDYYPYCDKDTDGDGLFDSDEINSGSDPNNAASTPEDWNHATCDDGSDNDLDGVTDGADNGCAGVCEPFPAKPLALASDATPVGTPTEGGGWSPGQTCDTDSDGDGYYDWDEINSGSDPASPASTPEAAWYPGTCADGADNDLDGQTDSADDACSSGCWPTPVPPDEPPTTEPGPTTDIGPSPSQPCIMDSDGDGVDDGTEQVLGSDPNDATSLPEHLKFPDSCNDGTDNDGDGPIDAADPGCQPDSDGDGVPDSTDNCPSAWNPDQADSDDDGTGDACADEDGDGFSDVEETSWGSDPNDLASTPEVLWIPGVCDDGQDNDTDGAADSADSGCAYPEPLPPGSGMPDEFVGKDANCDLRITVLDVLRILRDSAGLPGVAGDAPCPAGASATTPGDADCGGSVDVGDSLNLLKYFAGLSTSQGYC